ncbi:MAG: glycosyltransferase family 39 protein [Eubacteriales bacterium]|nr:glycosyltransferase family 39 protein [Eubacteriales bacterium]
MKTKLGDEPKYRLFFYMVLAAGIFARLWQFGIIPGDINQDEAFAGYEAYSILKYGIDTAGKHNPVYLVAWGSGMNALESYLMMPFIALFGLKVWVIRLPQVIVGILSLPAVYALVKRTVNERAGLLAMLMLAVCPWHIIASRWGLESNLAPGFLLFGLLYFVKALENEKYLMLSALMYGLSLYCYATYWIYIPFIILALLIYCLITKKLRFDRYMLFFGIILALFAVPLVLFLLINYGYIEEISTPLFTIPKLLYMRNSEMSFDEKAKKLELLKYIFFYQTDRTPWNSPSEYGLFYYCSMPFALAGLIFCIRGFVRGIKEKRFAPEFILLVQFVLALPQCLLIKANVTKINILFIPLAVFIALGIYWISTFTFRRFSIVLACLYTLLFIGFETYYFTDYVNETDAHFSRGFAEAFEYADSTGEHVYFEEGTFYPKVLFYSRIPVEEFRDTVEYEFYPSSYLTALGFGKYSMWADPYHPEENASYVISVSGDAGLLEASGFTGERFGYYTVYTHD